ncbi:MAG: cell division protein cell division transport system permease protein, partial [Candidatus Paceibacter sp.]|nr:cell division protein cell division transport system permease protein [Candidatus Paceibacter sp.]
MLWTNIKRVVKAGFINFWRNGYVSLASMLVMVLTLFVIGSIIFTNVMLTASLAQIKDKVDINVYFVTAAQEQDVLSIKQSIEALPEVKLVTYTSREQALADFKARHQNDQYTLQALDELQDNPLGATLNIKAKEPSQYGSIVTFLNSKNIAEKAGVPLIDKINYNQNKTAIDTLSRMIDAGQKIGLFLTIAFVVISIIITFNTIRLAIYSSREEISIMRLVGASSKYVRGPFVIVGIMYGIISAVIAMALFYPITYYLGRATQNFFGGVNVNGYYLQNFGQIFLILLGAGIVVG